MSNNTKYYCVGFNWHGATDRNQLKRFIDKGIWENGYEEKFQDIVNGIPVGSRLALKTTYTRKDNGRVISVLEIHALGTVTENLKDGHLLKVDWDKGFQPFKLDGKGAYRSTVSTVKNTDIIALIFNNKAPVTDMSASIPVNPEDKDFNHPLNQILYGPPGTGKTYHTINKAIAILEEYKLDRLSTYYDSRQSLKDRFDQALISEWENPEGQIAFVTFHQSMCYEDFVEGIKPVLSKSDNNKLIYKVEDGIFKKMARLAGRQHSRSINLDGQRVALTEELFEDLYYGFSETLFMADQQASNCALVTVEGYPFYLFRNSVDSIIVKAGEQKANMVVAFNELKKVLFENKVPTYKPYEQKIIDKILENKDYRESESDHIIKPFILIIDEINRGNISQIFGELITLIEGDKRHGNPEALEVILPYSKERFTVPSNLYIIGTMNTADRSVEALDTALRRRFHFEEIAPRAELLTPERMLWQFWWENEGFNWDDKAYVINENAFYQLLGFPEDKNNEADKEVYWGPMREVNEPKEEQILSLTSFVKTFTGINLSLLLIAINKRIEKLLSRDSMIGHAYLINVRSLDDLKSAFFNKIIPLLQEYFYGDYGRIGLVIGVSFIQSDDMARVSFMPIPGYEAGDLNENKVYNLKKIVDFLDNDAFLKAVKAIYE